MILPFPLTLLSLQVLDLCDQIEIGRHVGFVADGTWMVEPRRAQTLGQVLLVDHGVWRGVVGAVAGPMTECGGPRVVGVAQVDRYLVAGGGLALLQGRADGLVGGR